MNDDEIKNNPTFSELRKNAEQFIAARKVWPFLRPAAKLLGVDIESIDKILNEAAELAKQVEEMTTIPDLFNDIFSDNGWIFFESMEIDAAKRAIELSKSGGMDVAEEFLASYFSPEWVEKRIIWLKHVQGFRERFELAKLALEDYKAKRYYASVLVVLSLIDGWVSELNIIDFQRHGFFSEKSQLVAWDSMAAHPKGLVKLQKIFSKSRMRTRTEEIRIPYRHGIVHGMDLGYNNEYIAAKVWAALFAVREWAVKAVKGELEPPKLEPGMEKTFWESIENYQRVRKESERLKQWQPREVIIGQTIPATGTIEDYTPNTPERKVVEFLSYWNRNNYGFMAKCFAPFLQMSPREVRDQFSHIHLMGFELKALNEVSIAIADITVKLLLEKEVPDSEEIYEFRLALNDERGELTYIDRPNTFWGITMWRKIA